MSDRIGPIRKNVMNSASPTNTCVGGICCVPSAERRNCSEIITRVKLVNIIKSEGARAITLSMNRSWSAEAVPLGSSAPFRLMEMPGILGIISPEEAALETGPPGPSGPIFCAEALAFHNQSDSPSAKIKTAADKTKESPLLFIPPHPLYCPSS